MPDDDAIEPDLHGWKPSPLGEWEGFSPLDVKPYQPVLTPLDIPPYVPPKNHTSDVPHWAPGSGRPMDDLAELTLQQEIDLLNKNNIFLSTKQVSPTDQSRLGAMSGYVISDAGLTPATSFTPALRFTKVKVMETQRGLNQNTAYSYNEFESHLQRQLATESTVEFGIPKVFKVNTEFGYASSTATHSKDVTIHFAANKWIAGAEVVFDPTDITLDSSFVQAVRDIFDSRQDWDKKAEHLLEHLGQHGEFVPLTRVLGGRMSLTEATTLSDSSTFEATKIRFGLAADARFKINSVPGQAGGGNGTGYWTTDDQSRIEQAKTLKMKCVGGNAILADSNPIHLGGEWIDSVATYRLWRTIGFEEKTLVPIINFLPDDLPFRCSTLLRLYIYYHLHTQDTDFAGHRATTKNKDFDEKQLKRSDGKPWAAAGKGPNGPIFQELKKKSRGLSQIAVKSEGNVDSMKLSYRVYTGTLPGPSGGAADPVWPTTEVEGPYYGNTRSSPEETIKLSPGEEIRKLEVWIDPDVDRGVMRSLAITTSKGIRYPDAKGFFGANPKPGESNPMPGKYRHRIIEAPRVRVLRGSFGAFVHSLGLTYLDIDANAKSRGFLLAMEPFLFPTGDYGDLDLRPQ
jgi:hypothetical protein